MNKMKLAYKWKMEMSAIADMKALETHFALMAEKGWMFEKFGRFDFFKYKKIEPCKKRFCVDVTENYGNLEYRRLCESSGWTFVDSIREIHVFCADEETENPLPIHTDNKIQAQIYKKVCRSQLSLSDPNYTQNNIVGSVAVPLTYSYTEFYDDLIVGNTIHKSVSKFIAEGLYKYYLNKFFNIHSEYCHYLSSDELNFWGADDGAAFHFDISETKQQKIVFLLRGKAMLYFVYSFDGEDIYTDAAAQAVRKLWGELDEYK